MIEESGLQKPAEHDGLFETFDSVLSLNPRGVDLGSSNLEKRLNEDEEDGIEDESMTFLNKKIAEAEKAMKSINPSYSRAELRKLKDLQESKEDCKRLKRVELVYVRP